MAWVTLEEACEKHGIPSSVLRTWLEEGRIAGSAFCGYWMVSDESLSDYLEEFLKLALEYELSVCSESFYVLKTLKECQPLFDAVIRELSFFLLKESDRKLFYDLSMGKSIEKAARELGLTCLEVRGRYKQIVNSLRCKQGIVIGYRNRMLALSTQCRNYESKLSAFEKPADQILRNQKLPKIIPPGIALILSAPVEELFPESRIVHVLHRYEVYTVEDLFRLTKKHGFRIINKFQGMGVHSRRLLKLHLLEKQLIDQHGESYLYPYLVV